MDSKKDGDKDNNDDKPFDSKEYFGNRTVPIRGLITELTALCDRASDKEDQSSEESASIIDESDESSKLLINSDDSDSDDLFIDLNEHGQQIILIDEMIVDLTDDSKNDNACISLDKDIKQDELDSHQIISEVKMIVDVSTASKNDIACINLEEDVKQYELGEEQVVSDYNMIVDLTGDSENDDEYTSLDEHKGERYESDGEKRIDVLNDAGYKNICNICADENVNEVDRVKEVEFTNDIIEEDEDIMKDEVN
ncbi:uncharacterized protein LOC119690149 [Teleopsis dalmanni]|uniref:uncharacterized protein LOC119690149 n=1 Tax=Teleopsis dalmanni TaxID=139649 RepID=UPI0018CFAC55|nr:uncharacterized protein LOC119690149 [Teleopsis dalmanni]